LSSSFVILITGAARRVGARIAQLFHADGAQLAVHCHRSREEAQALVATLEAQRPGSTLLLQGDIAETAVCARLVDETLSRFGRLDGLVNNASGFYSTPLGQIAESDWNALLGSNLKGPLFLSQAAAPALRATQGSIVNVIDIHAERPLKGYAVYCAAKAGLLGLTRALAVDLGPDVRVNAVSPGVIAWPEDGQFDLQTREAILEQIVLKREGSPNDIAQTVRFLMREAPYITGQNLAVDGGRSIALMA
jgi:pteridine reductase